MPLQQAGVVDHIVVVDHSRDGTADIARRLGAEVHDQAAAVDVIECPLSRMLPAAA
jgi:glycosyltransferase involved in cell wall biosynthesis